MSYTKNKFKDFCKKIEDKYPKEKLKVLEYTGAKEKGKILCEKCGCVYEIKNASNFLSKYKKKICSKCFPREDTIEIGHKVEFLVQKSNNLKLLNSYTKITDDLEFLCLKCNGFFKRKPQIFLKSQKCPICETYSSLKTEDFFKQELLNKLNGEYELIGKYEGTNIRTLFKHNDCGFIFENTPHMILQKSPCPKCKRFNSKGEIKIKKFLENNHINYETQKHFSKLKQLSFDFYLPENNILIEYQGEQHFQPIKFFGGEKKYFKQVENDNLKRDFCKNNNYILIEIGYFDYDNIDGILNKWLNDYNP